VRTQFIDNLLIQAENDPSIWLLTADLGFSFLERFQERFAERYVNVGVAEQNLISIGSGLALSGKKVFLYSIINFLTFRALEQIRQNMCYHRLDVHLIGVGTGFGYKAAGYSHYAIEDIAIMQSLPYLRIYSPADTFQLDLVMQDIKNLKGPSYVRLGKHQNKLCIPLRGSLQEGFIYHQGSAIVCVVLGDLLYDLLDLVPRYFANKGLDPTVFSAALLKPFNGNLLKTIAVNASKIFVFEHHKASGLTALIKNIKIEHNLQASIESYALQEDAVDASALPSLEAFLDQGLM
jgi:transketolase